MDSSLLTLKGRQIQKLNPAKVEATIRGRPICNISFWEKRTPQIIRISQLLPFLDTLVTNQRKVKVNMASAENQHTWDRMFTITLP